VHSAVIPDQRSARQSASSNGRGRVAGLDGLRGLAALVVVVHHSLLTWPALAAQYGVPNPGSRTWWLAFTPVHLLWGGTEAVLVFFVLSGFVLTLPFVRTVRTAAWRSYYAQRLMRLYVPVVASVLLAAGLAAAFPRVHGPTTSWWFDAHAVPLHASTVLSDAALLGGVSWIHPSLWSLRYEVIFSLALPIFVVLARRGLLRLTGTVVLSLLSIGLGQFIASDLLGWLPVFAVGVAMAADRAQLDVLARRISACPVPGFAWAGLAGTGIALLLAEWWLRAVEVPVPWLMAIARPLGVLGAALVCFLAMSWPTLVRVCESTPVRWLGSVSFSLYLVHEPIVVSISSVVGGSKRGVLVTLVLGVVMSLAVAKIFHWLVEAPSHRLARAAGRRAAMGVVPAGQTTTDRTGVLLRPRNHLPEVPRPVPASFSNRQSRRDARLTASRTT
jgi:peptidoglycan/LPS O-acetylase OafA/YrhL